MNQLNRVIKFQNYDFHKSVKSFWYTMLLVNILSYLFFYNDLATGAMINDINDISIAAANLLTIGIYLLINWIVMYRENLSLALSFGITRKDYYKSIIINNIKIGLVFSIIQSVLQILDGYMMEYLGYNPLVEFEIFNTVTDNMFFIILALFICFSAIISIVNLIGILQFKFGYKLWIGIGVIFVLSQIIVNNFMQNVFTIFSFINFGRGLLFLILIIISILAYIIGYSLIKKISIIA